MDMYHRTKGFTIIELMIVVTIIATVASIAIPNFLRARMTANEASAIASLRTIATAQVTFRRQDYALPAPYNHPNTLEFAMPYTALFLTADGNQLQLIDLSLSQAYFALADAQPKNGYFYTDIQALIPVGGGAAVPMDNRMRYGMAAAPASYNLTGLNSYYCDDKGVVWQRDTGEGVTAPTYLIMDENPKNLGYTVAE